MLAPALAAALALLPAPIRSDWTVEERREERPYRTGATDDEIYDPIRRVLFVYASTVARSGEDARLELERAVITSAIYAYDREARWSERASWKSCNSWRGFMSTVMSPLEHAANEDPRGFADVRGRRSPRWDLASFAGRYFTQDTATKCRLLAQSRFLTDRLLELGENAAHPSCKNFDRWARVERIEHLEIDLASPTAQTIGSLFGHLFMRITGADNRVIAFLAESRGVLEDDPLYPFKGIFGGYDAGLFEKSFLDVHRDYVVTEARHIRRWKLNLSPEEQLRVLEIIWTRLHTARYSYYFFAQNCATLLLELFNVLVDGERPLVAEGSLGRGPASVLDALSLAPAHAGKPRIEYLADPFLSYRGEATIAERERAPIARKIAAGSEALEASIAVIEHADDPRQRAPAYERVAAFLAAAGEAELTAEEAELFLRASAKIEAHASAEANLEVDANLLRQRRQGEAALVKAYRESLPIELGAEAKPILELMEHSQESVRFAGYRAAAVLIKKLPEPLAGSLRLYVLARADLAFDTIKKHDASLHAELFLPDPARTVMEQNFVSGFEKLVERGNTTQVSPALLAVQRAKQKVHAARAVVTDRSRIEAEHAQRVALEQARYDRSYHHTGVDALSFAGGWSTQGRGLGLVLRGAAYEETFGEQRRHGFPSTTAFTFLRSDSFWTRGDDWRPIVERSETRLIGYRSVGEARRFGLELYADLSTRRTDHTDLSPSAGAGGLWSLISSEDFADHVIASAGLAYEAHLPSDARGDRHQVAAPIALELRKGLAGPLHALRGSFSARPRFDVPTQNFDLLLRGEGELRWLLAEDADLYLAQDVGVSLVARARWERAPKTPEEDRLFFDLGVTFD